MPEPGYVLAALLAAGAVTLALRVLPFALLHGVRETPVVRALETVLPAGFMVILTVYALNHLDVQGGRGVAAAVAVVVTVGLHLWRRNAVLSIFAGTAVYVLAVNAVLA